MTSRSFPVGKCFGSVLVSEGSIHAGCGPVSFTFGEVDWTEDEKLVIGVSMFLPQVDCHSFQESPESNTGQFLGKCVCLRLTSSP